jgi:hypothetical protein
MLKLLQKYGADLHKPNDQGNVLHFACAQDHIEVVEYLMKEDIPINT